MQIMRFVGGLTALGLLFVSSYASSESLSTYVSTCKDQLEISSIPNYSCTQTGTIVVSLIDASTRVGRLAAGDRIDAVFLCRGISGSTVALNGLILHNRDNGNTCFFDSKRNVSINAPSPDSNNAGNYWSSPDDLAANNPSQSRCSDCHTNGPFIVSDKIVDAMATLGLLNNGRDTMLTRYAAVGTAHSGWNSKFVDKNSDGSCAGVCHAGAEGSAIPSLMADARTGKWMAPTGSSAFRWVNRDTTNATGDWETKTAIDSEFGSQGLTCNPAREFSARIVGTTLEYKETPNKLKYFNIHQGLACDNDAQSNGSCSDYEVRYKCNSTWSAWIDADNPAGTGDYEKRADFTGCTSPKEIQARVVGTSVIYQGFPDILDQFGADRGLGCKHADQPGGKCNDYQVKWRCN